MKIGSTALAALALVLTLSGPTTPVFADGGTGGGLDGGLGGADSDTGTGGTGSSLGGGFSGGGGGAGATGGQGGGSGILAGGDGGTAPGGDGGDGGAGNTAGTGGGGGAHGSVTTGLPGSDLRGGAGGDGGDQTVPGLIGEGIGGGGGGAGGYGAVVTGSGVSGDIGVTIIGGDGGDGGTSPSDDGGGGSGGIGLLFTETDNQVTIGASSIISGGNGGGGSTGGDGGIGVSFMGGTLTNTGEITGGDGGVGAATGDGGVGIAAGSDVTIINSGTISSGAGQANAITFGSGSNRLEVQEGFTINGNVDATAGGDDTFTLGGDARGTFDISTIGAQYQGFEAFEKTGGSSWTLTGTTDTTAPWTISTGTLQVDGTLSGPMAVNDGGTLGGSGTVGTTTVAEGGTIAPGNSIGTLSVNGNITFASGSTYEVEVDPEGTDSDLIQATGSAILNGGSVQVGPGGSPATTYTIVTADNGVTGTFDGVSSNFAFLDPTLSFGPNNVFLELTRNEVGFPDIAKSRNQIAAAIAVESLGTGAGVFDAVVQLDAAAAQSAFDQVSGEIHASAQTVLIEDSRFLREVAVSRVSSAFDTVDTVDAVDAPTLVKAAFSNPEWANTGRFTVWGRAFGSWGHIDSDGNATKLERNIGGVFVGGDVLIAEQWRLGLLTGYSHASFDVHDRDSSGDSDNYSLGVYGGTAWGALGLRLGAAYTWHDVDTKRRIAFPGFAENTKASYDAGTAQVFGELGYRIDTTVASFEPFADLAYVNLHTDGFDEDGGATALSVDGETTETIFSTLGLRAATDFALGTMPTQVFGELGWRHAFDDVTPHSTLTFAGGDAFAIEGVSIAKDAAVIEAGLDLDLTASVTFGLSYSGQIASDAQDNGLRADLSVRL